MSDEAPSRAQLVDVIRGDWEVTEQCDGRQFATCKERAETERGWVALQWTYSLGIVQVTCVNKSPDGPSPNEKYTAFLPKSLDNLRKLREKVAPRLRELVGAVHPADLD